MGLVDAKPDPEFLDMGETFDGIQFRRLQNPIKLIKFFYDKTAEGKRYYEMISNLRNYAYGLLRKRMDQICDTNSNSDGQKLTLCDTLIKEHLRDPIMMPLDAILDEFITFLAAGWDSTTWAASFMLQMIGQHPNVQEKIIDEMDAIFGSAPTVEDIKMEDINKLKYLECVIYETLRLLPVIGLFGRHLHEDLSVCIDNETRIIPAGTEILIDSELIHKSPRYWNDPEKFLPERFLDACTDRDPLAFLAFSFGPRNCIGKQFVLIEEKIIITYILRAFKIEAVDPIDKIRMNVAGLARRTYEPIKLIFKPRS